MCSRREEDEGGTSNPKERYVARTTDAGPVSDSIDDQAAPNKWREAVMTNLTQKNLRATSKHPPLGVDRSPPRPVSGPEKNSFY